MSDEVQKGKGKNVWDKCTPLKLLLSTHCLVVLLFYFSLSAFLFSCFHLPYSSPPSFSSACFMSSLSSLTFNECRGLMALLSWPWLNGNNRSVVNSFPNYGLAMNFNGIWSQYHQLANLRMLSRAQKGVNQKWQEGSCEAKHVPEWQHCPVIVVGLFVCERNDCRLQSSLNVILLGLTLEFRSGSCEFTSICTLPWQLGSVVRVMKINNGSSYSSEKVNKWHFINVTGCRFHVINCDRKWIEICCAANLSQSCAHHHFRWINEIV